MRKWPIWLMALMLAGCHRAPQQIVLSGPTMGTTYNIKVKDAPGVPDSHALRATVDAVLADIDIAMSGYRSDSEVSRFNASTSVEWFEVSVDLANVVHVAQQVSAESGGALDITVAPLVSLWGFGPAGEVVRWPDDTEIAALRSRVGYRLLEVRSVPAALRKKVPELMIDLNAVAPGFAVDKLAARFTQLGIRDFMIDIGGEVLARGRNAEGESWRIAVEKPVDGQPQPLLILQIPDRSVTTSGEYRHYYERDGRRYSHTIDPRSGRPVEHNLASVVVIGENSLLVDAWATALNVLGAEDGFTLATQRSMQAMFLVQEGGEVAARQTPGFESFVIDSPKQ